MAIHPVILAGGSGTRLWPLSRESHPKQFLPLTGDRTMLQETVSRLDGMDGVADPIFVCNEVHRFLLVEQVRPLGQNPRAVILEPTGRNTAPALTLAALRLLQMRVDPGDDPVMLAMPADHVISDVDAFQTAVRTGAELADSGYMVTFGVLPDSPETGYGYIRKGEPLDRSTGGGPDAASSAAVASVAGPMHAAAFVEKPDPATARAYLDSSEYLWNSGMFMMRASVWLDELERHRSDIAHACRTAHEKSQHDGDFTRPDVEAFSACPSESIDYAVMGEGSRTAGGVAFVRRMRRRATERRLVGRGGVVGPVGREGTRHQRQRGPGRRVHSLDQERTAACAAPSGDDGRHRRHRRRRDG